MMPAGARKAALAVHITASVGWIGAVLAYLVFDTMVATGSDADLVRSSFVAMHLITKWVLLPLAMVAWSTGLLMALGSKWGLWRHYWVVISLILTTLAGVVLVVESFTIAELANRASDASLSDGEILAMPSTLPHSIGGLAILLFVNVLNIVKPRGLTKYGWRKSQTGRVDR